MPYDPVPPEVAIAALRACGTDVVIGPNHEVSLVKGDYEETLIFPPEGLKKHMLWRLKYHCGVPIQWFFNPELIPGYEPPKPN